MTDVIYVDRRDNVIGSGTIRFAVENGIIRRVSRVIIVDDRGDILLQKRSTKISYPGLWNDSVSGHVDVGESYLEAAVREMKEEMGIVGVPLTELGKLYGEEPDPPHLRRAFNMLYAGTFNGTPSVDPDEVAEARLVPRAELESWLTEKPSDFTPGSFMSLKFYLALRGGKFNGSSS
ncbi:MAG: NUDIX domain-containing protein [Patescibacteria group bacterium]